MTTSDNLAAFLEEHGYSIPGSTVTASDFVGAFRQWCREHGARVPTRRDILAAVERFGYPIGRTAKQTCIGNLSLSAPQPPRTLTVNDDGHLVYI